MRDEVGSTAHVPAVVDALSSGRVLTMEWIDGTSLAAAQDGVDRRRLAARVVACFATQYLCASMFHADPHAGQFEVEGETDCARCHTDALASFLAFDHDRDARFALGEAHAGVECSACHPAREQGGKLVVRYRPVPSECFDCHGVHEEVLLRQRPRKR